MLNYRRVTTNKVPPPIANSVLFTFLIRRCNISCAKFFQNLGHHLPQGMAMIASPLPLVGIVPYLIISQHSKVCSLHSLYGHGLEWNLCSTPNISPTSVCQLWSYDHLVFSLIWPTLARRHVEDMLSGIATINPSLP